MHKKSQLITFILIIATLTAVSPVLAGSGNSIIVDLLKESSFQSMVRITI
ncbi:MAG: hypothetical protein ACXABI_17695 [Candidatus Hodarchaeales archaeon]